MKYSDLHPIFQPVAMAPVSSAITIILAQKGVEKLPAEKPISIVCPVGFINLLADEVGQALLDAHIDVFVKGPKEFSELVEDCLKQDARITPIIQPW